MKAFGFLVILLAFSVFSVARTHPDTVRIRDLKKQVSDFSESGMYDSAIAYATQLKTLCKQHKRWKELLKAQLEVSSCQLQQSALEEARVSLAEGFDLVKQFLPEDPFTLAELYNLSGILCYEQGDYEQAIGHLKRSLAYQQKLGEKASPRDLATRYNNIAAIVSRMGDYDEAIFYYTRSLDLRRQHGEPLEIGESYNNLSVSYYRKRMFREARDYQEQYLEILNALNDKGLIKEYIVCYNSLGIYYFELKDYPKALAILNKALDLNRTTDYFIEKTYHNLGYVYRMMEDDEQAFHFLHLALERNKKKYKDSHPDIGKEYRHLGVIHARRADTEKALYYFQKALIQLTGNFSDSSITANPALTSIRSKPDLLRTLRDKAVALRDWSKSKHDPRFMKASLETSRLAMALAEQMRDEYESEAARQFINEEALPVYAGALETIYCLPEKNTAPLLAQAFEIIEKSKALLLMESLQRRKKADAFGVPDSLLVKERRLRTAIAFYEKQLADAEGKKDQALTTLASKYLDGYHDQARALQQLFEKNFPHYFASRHRIAVTPLETIRLLLKNDQTCMVEYFLSDDKLWTLLITPEQVRLIEKERPAPFDQWVASYQKSLKDHTFIMDSPVQCYEQYTHSAYELYQYLLSDVADEAVSGRYPKLLIVPHHELTYLPFESFLLRPAPREFKGYTSLDYLIKKMQVSYAYSGSLHLELRNRLSNSQAKCVAFGPAFNTPDGAKDPELPFLPHIREELEAIQQVFKGSFFYEKEATKEMFREESGQYGIVHLATHSVMDEHTPSNSRIYFAPVSGLADEHVLYAYEIANLSLDADLVVLSACETGSGKLARGEGVMSIGRSFLYAGSNSVLMNLWRSEDKANASIIASFYSGLAEGETKINSLHQAKLKYITGSDEFHAHPTFWAGYVLVGNEGTLNTTQPILLTAVIVGALCILLWLAVRKFYRYGRSQGARLAQKNTASL
jgi:CHAT domain-containing protein/Tfp pilus assembly protein PilF